MKPVARHPRHRRCLVLRGRATETFKAALWLTHELSAEDVLWVGDGLPAGLEEASAGAADPASGSVGHVPPDVAQGEAWEVAPRWTSPRALRRRLGASSDAVVLDLHQGLDADVLAQCHGFIRGGGALLLRMSGDAAPPASGRARLALHPHTPEEVTDHCWRRLIHQLRAAPFVEDRRAEAWHDVAPLSPAPRDLSGTPEQAQLVSRLVALLHEPAPQVMVLTADRGRGKSSALGLAMARFPVEGSSHTADVSVGPAPRHERPAPDDASTTAPIILTAADERALMEVRRFAAQPSLDPLNAPEPPDGPSAARLPQVSGSSSLSYVSPAELARVSHDVRVIVVDEAAQLPVPLLQALTRRHPQAHLIFATTTHGYEGTGRGFALRFRAWLARQRRPVTDLTLRAPIRWEVDDPLEALVFKALALDAEPAKVAAPSSSQRLAAERASQRRAPALVHVIEDRAALAMDDERLRAIFGLLVQAHYRTTPADLQRMLDAPNLTLHTLARGGDLVAVNLVASEGGLSEALCRRMLTGKERVRGHALPDTLICHAGHVEAGALPMIRSVRIAAHPQLRRHGLARTLTERVHEAHAPELFGTLFAAEVGVLRFRQSLGYRLVRVGTSLSARTGTPSLVMVRPRTERAHKLTRSLRAAMARDLPWQLRLMTQGGAHTMDPALSAAIEADLPAPAPLSVEEALKAARQVAFGARHFEAAAWPIRHLLSQHPERLRALPERDAVILSARAVEGRSWAQVTHQAGLGSPRMTMRALRRALQAFLKGFEGIKAGDGEP